MLLGIVSDTHAPRFWKQMPDGVREALRDVDLICHAGDVCQPFVLDELASLAPVRAVRGNNDGDDVAAWGAPNELVWTEAGLTIAMVHDGGPRTGRANRLQRRFPQAGLIIYGHSHIPMIDEGTDGVVIVNPGSPTDKRRQPYRTLLRVTIKDRRVQQIEPVRLP